MKFTLDWLHEHLDTSASPAEIGETLTKVGLELEGMEDQARVLSAFVTAHVVSAEQHPNADKLRVCKVDAGTGELIDVVCGAPNARTGLKSVFAFPGTYIPGKDMTIGKGNIRGQVSNGMLCSNAEEPAEVMPRYAQWVESLPGPKVFVAAPMIFDGLWMDHYLDEFAGTRALSGPFKGRQIFRGGGICLYTMAGTLRGAPYLDWGMSKLPAEFYGHIAHTHKAIDDACGFANVLVELLKISRALPPIQGSKSDFR